LFFCHRFSEGRRGYQVSVGPFNRETAKGGKSPIGDKSSLGGKGEKSDSCRSWGRNSVLGHQGEYTPVNSQSSGAQGKEGGKKRGVGPCARDLKEGKKRGKWKKGGPSRCASLEKVRTVPQVTRKRAETFRNWNQKWRDDLVQRGVDCTAKKMAEEEKKRHHSRTPCGAQVNPIRIKGPRPWEKKKKGQRPFS